MVVLLLVLLMLKPTIHRFHGNKEHSYIATARAGSTNAEPLDESNRIESICPRNYNTPAPSNAMQCNTSARTRRVMLLRVPGRPTAAFSTVWIHLGYAYALVLLLVLVQYFARV